MAASAAITFHEINRPHPSQILSALAFSPPSDNPPQSQATAPPHVFSTQDDHFTLDGKPFKILSGELHYARIPREYWHARLKMARAMGLNTIATYVFWNVHEPTPGHFDFTGNNDLAAFIKAAQEEGLYVILRSGPYACAEWEFGGLPAWLLANPQSAVHPPHQRSRLHDPRRALDQPPRPGDRPPPDRPRRPIIMTQIENEYGNFGNDHAYLAHPNRSTSPSASPPPLATLGSADTVTAATIPNGALDPLSPVPTSASASTRRQMDALAKLHPDASLVVSEYWPGWFDDWGHPHQTRPSEPSSKTSTTSSTAAPESTSTCSTAAPASASCPEPPEPTPAYLPDVTSYDYDAPLDESGRPTPKYFAYRKLLAKFATCSSPSPPTEKLRHPDRMRRTLPPQWSDLRLHLLLGTPRLQPWVS